MKTKVFNLNFIHHGGHRITQSFFFLLGEAIRQTTLNLQP